MSILGTVGYIATTNYEVCPQRRGEVGDLIPQGSFDIQEL